MNEALTNIVEDLAFFDEWEDRYRYLIDLGKALPTLSETERDEPHLVRGCQSQVWLHVAHEQQTDALSLRMDSDAIIVRGLIALIATAYNGLTPKAALAFDIDGLFEQLDLMNHLSMARGNGLRAMVAKIRESAAGFA